MGGGEAKQGTEILNICLLNTYSIPGHILGSGERAVNKMGKVSALGGIRNRHLTWYSRKSARLGVSVLAALLICILVGRFRH